MIPRTGRSITLLCLLALHATISLCGPGHHALDAFGRPGEARSCQEDGTAVLASADGGCAVCDLLSLPVLPVASAAPAMRDDVAASPVLLVQAVHRRNLLLPAAPPRAPPSRSI